MSALPQPQSRRGWRTGTGGPQCEAFKALGQVPDNVGNAVVSAMPGRTKA